MRKRFTHYLIFTIIAIMFSSHLVFANSSSSVTVQIPSFKVNVNNQLIDNVNSKYPLLVYKGVTYFPMTWNYTQALGLQFKWDNKEGFSISKGSVTNTLVTQELGVKNNTNAKYTATLPTFKIRVNGNEINNKNEEYPLLTFRNITYFPMTWRFAVEELGLQTNWGNIEGFSLNTGNYVATIDSNIQKQKNNSIDIEFYKSSIDSYIIFTNELDETNTLEKISKAFMEGKDISSQLSKIRNRIQEYTDDVLVNIEPPREFKELHKNITITFYYLELSVIDMQIAVEDFKSSNLFEARKSVEESRYNFYKSIEYFQMSLDEIY